MRYNIILLVFVALSSCSDDNATVIEPEVPRQTSITLMVTENSLGDNGYNDSAAEGVMAFATETGTPLHLLLPADITEADAMYSRWLSDNAGADSAVLIMGSPAYAEIANAHKPVLTGRGSRVLLFESCDTIEGVSTVMINRYGVSYLAAAMSKDFDALILAATEGYSTLEASIRGFQDGRTFHAGSHNGKECNTELHYLAKGEEGFSMPDSAYRFIAQRAEEWLYHDEMIFPLLGGSQSGIVNRLNDDQFTGALMIGMDTDMAGRCRRLPFSVEIRIGEVLRQMLHGWLAGEDWPLQYNPGMGEGAADIVPNPFFGENLILWDDRYSNPDEFLMRYEQFKDEALKKETEYEN